MWMMIMTCFGYLLDKNTGQVPLNYLTVVAPVETEQSISLSGRPSWRL